MFEKKLEELIRKAKEERNNSDGDYSYDVFDELTRFINKNLNSFLLKGNNTKIIVNHFDEILPFIVSSNIDILLFHIKDFIKYENFSKKFAEGIKNYKYKDGIIELINNIRISIPESFDTFMNSDILNALAIKDLNSLLYGDILNWLNESKQKEFLEILVNNKCNIPYLYVEYKGNNKQILCDNVELLINNSPNLYNLMKFVEDDKIALNKVKEFIDNNEDRAIDSIFCETEQLVRITNPDIKEYIRLIIKDTIRNEKAKYSDITYNGGGLSRIMIIGDKVIKIGSRVTKKFPNNPYIIAPLNRKELDFDGDKCFVEVTQRVDTKSKVTEEDLYQLFKNIRNLGLVWTDIKVINVGRLLEDNVTHWNEELNPSDETLGLQTKRGDKVLKKGELVILDADLIYDEKDPNINYVDRYEIYKKFEERYQKEKKDLNINNKVEKSSKFKDIKEPKEKDKVEEVILEHEEILSEENNKTL